MRAYGWIQYGRNHQTYSMDPMSIKIIKVLRSSYDQVLFIYSRMHSSKLSIELIRELKEEITS